MTPLVSILIPAYNAEEYIGETLESAVAQTYPHREIIVVNDGSRDRTLEIARSFEPRGVTVVTQQNQGAAAARNAALKASRGDYIQWLDADDLLGPEKIERQIASVGKNPDPQVLLSSEWGRFLYRPDRAEFTPTALWSDLSPADWLRLKLGNNLYMQTATWLVSRQLTEAAGPWNTELLGDDDGEYFCRVLLRSRAVRFVPGARVFYRLAGADTLSNIGQSDRKMEAHIHSMRLHLGYMRSLDDSEQVHRACVQYLQTSLIHVYPERPDIVEQMQAMAAEFGGRLTLPKLSWKYALLGAVFGMRQAKRMQGQLRGFRWAVTRKWDRTLARFSGSRPPRTA
jgi:glycosyltransferase involved in cell wall biosynthesis